MEQGAICKPSTGDSCDQDDVCTGISSQVGTVSLWEAWLYYWFEVVTHWVKLYLFDMQCSQVYEDNGSDCSGSGDEVCQVVFTYRLF